MEEQCRRYCGAAESGSRGCRSINCIVGAQLLLGVTRPMRMAHSSTALPTPSLGNILIISFIIDTWQYFLHRAFHTSTFLYKHIHSVHHRLYVPFAFGALYNHPLEGFLFDTLGATLAHELSGMTVRQATLLFGVSTMKTVDDHAGYRLWWDPCQLFFSNNADFHDIHHQSHGIKANFAQPYL